METFAKMVCGSSSVNVKHYTMAQALNKFGIRDFATKKSTSGPILSKSVTFTFLFID